MTLITQMQFQVTKADFVALVLARDEYKNRKARDDA